MEKPWLLPSPDILSANASRSFHELLESPEFQNSKAQIPLAMGRNARGKALVEDLAGMPHLLVAASHDSEKSACLNGVLASLLFRFSPEDLALVLMGSEMTAHHALPHLAMPVIHDPEKAMVGLRWVIRVMENNYRIMAQVGVRNVHTFNRSHPKENSLQDRISMETHRKIMKAKKDHGLPEKIPHLVVVISELQDLMQSSSVEVENAITTITAMARAAGIHLIIGTRMPSPDVVTESIKASLPAKFVFQTASAHHSRVALGVNGAEKLRGKGDLLFKVDDCPKVHPVQCDGLDDDGMRALVNFWAGQASCHHARRACAAWAVFDEDPAPDGAMMRMVLGKRGSDPRWN